MSARELWRQEYRAYRLHGTGPREQFPGRVMERMAAGRNFLNVPRDEACTNSQPGSFNAECGKRAVWIGTHESGHRQRFCERCKTHGAERMTVKRWELI